MEIIGRVAIFVQWLVLTGIGGIILLMILRLVANYANLNPFAWPSLTIRRLTDPLVGPVRRTLMGFGADAKYAPLVTILVAILLGWFVFVLTGSLAATLAGVLQSVQQRTPAPLIGWILYGALDILKLLILIRVIFSWAMISYSNRVMRFLVKSTEPLIGPLRQVLPLLGPIDISPIVAWLIIWLFQTAIMGTLLQNTASMLRF
jgi:YggT family protein